MKISKLVSRTIVPVFALLVFASLANLASVASAQKQSTGGMRAGDGQPLRVTVLLGAKPWAKASVVITKADGTAAVKGLTTDAGTYTTNSLDGGSYTVTASTTHWTATGNVTLVKSTDSAFLKLTLEKKAPTAAPAPAPAAKPAPAPTK